MIRIYWSVTDSKTYLWWLILNEEWCCPQNMGLPTTKIIKYLGARYKLLMKPVIMDQLIKHFRWKSKVRYHVHKVGQRLFCRDGGIQSTRAQPTYLRPFLILSCHLTLRLSPCKFFKFISRTDNCSDFWNHFLSFVKMLWQLENFLWKNKNSLFHVELINVLSHYIYRRFSNLLLLIPSLDSINF